ncbi:superoxide dismutase [candidate division KSB1 bacterium]|nr:superoxide dismutase [candidate division KSB1 bacterium]
MKIQRLLLFVLLVSGLYSQTAFSHCEIPCGIYGDKMRFDMLEEAITTVEKSMNQISSLSAETPVNYNQLVRWINNKDKHADDIREIAVQYFLAQRINPVDPADEAAVKKYQAQLQALHLMVVHAMKAKQTTDLKNVDKLRELVEEFYKLYFDEEMEKHLEEHKH